MSQTMRDWQDALRRLLDSPVAADVVQRVRERLLTATVMPDEREMLTLDEVAELLRLDEQQLDLVLDELPAFELAGVVRVRRARLNEWIEQRERQYIAQCLQSQAARVLKIGLSKGVA